MKPLQFIRVEKPYYYVCIDGVNEFESPSIKECKNYLIKYLKDLELKGLQIENENDYYIGMYNIE